MNDKRDNISMLYGLLEGSVAMLKGIQIPVFQQIDVEEAIDSSNGAVALRMFGVTQVCILDHTVTSSDF